MGIEKFKVKFTPKSRASLKNIFDHISRKSSRETAVRVSSELIRLAKTLDRHPRRFAIEDNIAYQNREIRSLPKWSYKIIYEIEGNTVRILKFFHTSRNPDKMEE